MIEPRDEGDIATDYQSRHNADALARHEARNGRALGPAPTHCEECGEEIPAARRDALPGCRLCVECQTVAERLREGM